VYGRKIVLQVSRMHNKAIHFSLTLLFLKNVLPLCAKFNCFIEFSCFIDRCLTVGWTWQATVAANDHCL